MQGKKPIRPCKECKRERVKARGRCARCYDRWLYADLQRRDGRQIRRRLFEYLQDDFYGAGMPCQPTPARPGTADKIEVMRERAEMRQQIFHESDGRIEL